jgi:hypothetical protein
LDFLNGEQNAFYFFEFLLAGLILGCEVLENQGEAGMFFKFY